MTTRPSRSASIPIPRSSSSSLSPSRNIETAIPMTFAASSRSRMSAAQRGDEHRGPSISYSTRGGSSPSSSTARRPTARSSSVIFRAPSAIIPGAVAAQRSSLSFEPRVVRITSDHYTPRAGGSGTGSGEICNPSSDGPVRTRRQSGAGSGGRAAGIQRHSTAPTTHFSPAHHPSASFSPPTYLNHSVLRNLLQTEPPQTLPVARRSEVMLHSYPSAASPLSDSDDESNVTPPRELQPPNSRSQDEVLRLPTRWSEQYRHSLLSISTDGRELSYHGTSCSGDRDAAAARTNYPIPPACGIYYYEVEITNKGQKGHISIGFAARDVKLSRLPGWETNSWGYHGDDGCSFADKSGTGTPYGPTFGTGDIVGCGIDFTTHQAFFTKNGALIAPVFENIGKEIEIYPSVGLRHSGEHVRVNFGQEPFKFDIDYHVQQQQNSVWTKILTMPVDVSLSDACGYGQPESARTGGEGDGSRSKKALTDEQTREVINNLILSYLEHHGYAKTMRTFRRQLNGGAAADSASMSSSSPSPSFGYRLEHNSDVNMTTVDDSAPSASSRDSERSEAESDIDRRTSIVKSVVAGDIDRAMADTQTHYSTVLEAEEGLMLFKLKCRRFVELILQAAEMKKRMSEHTGREDGSGTGSTRGMVLQNARVDGFGAGGSGSRSMNGSTLGASRSVVEDSGARMVDAMVTDGVVEDVEASRSGTGMDVDEDSPDSPPSGLDLTTNGFGGSSPLPIPVFRRRTSHSRAGAGSIGVINISPSGSSSRPGIVTDGIAAQYEVALNRAILYGQTLSNAYKDDTRPEVKQLFKRTFAIVAWEDPASAAGVVGEVVGHEAKIALASELNKAILKSQGHPTEPLLETLYRHAAVCIAELGLRGVGGAALADMHREFLDG